MIKFLSEKWKDGKEPLIYLFSWTLLLASILKFKCEDCKAKRKISITTGGFDLPKQLPVDFPGFQGHQIRKRGSSFSKDNSGS